MNIRTGFYADNIVFNQNMQFDKCVALFLKYVGMSLVEHYQFIQNTKLFKKININPHLLLV